MKLRWPIGVCLSIENGMRAKHHRLNPEQKDHLKIMRENVYRRLLPEDFDANTPVIIDERGFSWTRPKLDTLISNIASALLNIGVQPGDRVGAKIDKSVHSFCLYLATLRVGAVWLPMNTAYTQAEVELILSDASPLVLVSSEPMEVPNVACFTMASDGSGTLMQAANNTRNVQLVYRDSDDLAAILYTSGTTGRPKGAMITHGNLEFCAETLADFWGVTRRDTLLHALPTFHAHGLFIAANTMLAARASMVFLSRFDPEQVLSLLPRATIFMGVPTLYSRLLASERLSKALCENVRVFISGSAPLSAETFEEFRARTGHSILERYGMTETTVITSNPLSGERVAGSVGYALPGVSIVALRKDGGLAPVDEVGELVVKGPNVFKGYWNLPEKTAAEFTREGYFKSGDLVRIDSHDRIWIVGRNKDLIITGGYNVYPREVEACLVSFSAVRDCAVIGVPHPDFGEGVIAVVELKEKEVFEAKSVIADLSSRLAKYKIPKKIVVVPSLPRNAMGKIQKNELKEAFSSAFSSESCAVPN
ncbi:AMP-binding protein [Bradyrhizobium iriomotense]|uniref:Malonyl-CoA synthase n=1 Tax=Bradyrhizobium iriomotense TaxID=441950 RepID=A0ABQ6BCV7_9BRAD|nr:AMP-binding protein [Bradyrhizobium iriomotense]GLR91676.1 malonyl-CoA synthase [Bradyrhizobium iriomotense]